MSTQAWPHLYCYHGFKRRHGEWGRLRGTSPRDANDCIMVGLVRGYRIQGCIAAVRRARWRVPPLIVTKSRAPAAGQMPTTCPAKKHWSQIWTLDKKSPIQGIRPLSFLFYAASSLGRRVRLKAARLKTNCPPTRSTPRSMVWLCKPNRVAPAHWLLHPFADALAYGISGMPRGVAFDGRALGFRRHMRRHIHQL